MVVATGARSYDECLEITFDVFQAARDLLKARGHLCGVADEGGYWPVYRSNEEAFETFACAVARAGFTLGREASLSLDIAASDLYDEESGTYRLKRDGRTLNPDEFMDQIARWCRDFRVVSVEDPAADTDWAGWERLFAACGDTIQIVGDDLFTTNPARIEDGIRRGVANSVLIKLNQIGTVTETIDAIRLTQSAGWAPVVSARSGETEDAFIAHLAVATNAGQLKVGSFCRSERMVKWNECLRIARLLGDRARFEGAGKLARRGSPISARESVGIPA
jgi:enolase